jgi:hypothetical protein
VVDFPWDFYFIFCAALGVKKPTEAMNTAKTQTADAGEFILKKIVIRNRGSGSRQTVKKPVRLEILSVSLPQN